MLATLRHQFLKLLSFYCFSTLFEVFVDVFGREGRLFWVVIIPEHLLVLLFVLGIASREF